MKLVINYDFFNALKDVNEKTTPLTIIRNEKADYGKFVIPVWLTLSVLQYKSEFIKNIPQILLGGSIAVYTNALIALRFGNINYREKADRNLKTLVKCFNELNIETDYDLLLQSQLDSRNYRLYLNEEKLPEILESKYILVPTYNHLGDIKNTSILQEHVIGSKNYVLSLGSPKKKRKLAYSNV